MQEKVLGSGSYHQDKNGRFYWRTTITKRNGTKQRKKIEAKTLEELQKKVAAFRADEKRGFFSTEPTVEEFAALFLQTNKETLAGKTYRNYIYVLNNYIVPTFKERKLKTIKPFELTFWFSELLKKPLSISTVLSIRRIFSVFMSDALKNGFIKSNPVSMSKAPRAHKKQITAPTIEEIIKVVATAKEIAEKENKNVGTDYLNKMYYVLVRMSVMTGLRIGEAAALRWSDFDKEKCSLQISHSVSVDYNGKEIISNTKTETSTRTILLDDETVALLKQWRAYQHYYISSVGDFYTKRNLIFSNSSGNVMLRTNFTRRYFHPLLQSCGIITGGGTHMLRRFHASLLANANMPLTLIAKRLGHADVSVLEQHYLTTVDDQRKIVSTLNDFDKEIDKNSK